ALRGILTAFGSTLYPEIVGDGELAPMPPEARELAVRIARRLSPRCEFDPETFVIKGYWAPFGALYRDREFACRNPATTRYFARNLPEDTYDGVLAYGRVKRPGDAE